MRGTPFNIFLVVLLVWGFLAVVFLVECLRLLFAFNMPLVGNFSFFFNSTISDLYTLTIIFFYVF